MSDEDRLVSQVLLAMDSEQGRRGLACGLTRHDLGHSHDGLNQRYLEGRSIGQWLLGAIKGQLPQ